jgi:tetratricopeptide (TPR) repeat protein
MVIVEDIHWSDENSDEVEVMIRAIFGLSHAVSTDFVTHIYTDTEGNPFFIEEMLKSLVASGEITYGDGKWVRIPRETEAVQRTAFHNHPHLPRSSLLTIQQRLQLVSVEARDVHSFAAVLGRRFDFTLLRHLTGRSEIDLVRLVKELIAAQLIVEESEDVLAFRHALTRQAAYADLLVRERRSLHHSVAQTIERLYVHELDRHLEDLAYQYYMAGEWEKVLQYAQRAGEKAQALYAPHAAIEQYSHAVEAVQRLSKPPLPTLLRARGQCYEALGEFAAARDDYQRVLELAQQAHDQTMAWQSLLDLGSLWTGLDYTEAGEYLDRALALARTTKDPLILARTLNRVGNWQMNLEEPLKGLEHHREALSLFQASSDQRGLAETLDFLGVASLMSGDLLASADYYAQAIALAHRLGLRSSEAFSLIFGGLCLGYRGEYGRALSSAERGLRIAEEIEHGPWMATGYLLLGIISLELLDFQNAQRQLERALRLAIESGSLFLIRNAKAFLASTYTSQGEYTQAESLLENVFGPETPYQTIAQRLVWCAHAELELARSRPDKALTIIDRLLSTATHIEASEVIPRVWHLRGEALIALDRTEEAFVVLCSARDEAQRQGIHPLLWRICVALGKLYRATARSAQAEEAIALARTTIQELANTIENETRRTTFVQQSLAYLPSPPRPSPRQVAKQAYGGLTAREREVAVLIAQGKSSRAIADELILSERTIEKYVERIMFRLGFTSRVQIATWVVEKGLLDTSV